MRRPKLGTILNHLALVVPLAVAFTADADRLIDDLDIEFSAKRAMPHNRPFPSQPFQLIDRSLGKAVPPEPADRLASLAGSSIVPLNDGALVVDPDSGELARLDTDQRVQARLSVGVGTSQVVWDRDATLAYAVDRRGDRIVVVSTANEKLEKLRSFATRTEPYGVALSPDGATLFVTAIVDRALTAYDTKSGRELWSVDIGPEPRGLAVSPDGTRALVASLTSGSIARVALDDAEHRVDLLPLDPPAPATTTLNSRVPSGRGFARNAFAALYIGHDLAFTGHQISNPDQSVAGQENRGTYGGGFAPPIAHRLTFIGKDGRLAAAGVQAHQPRALAYDAKADVAYFAGYGSDTVVAILDASQASARLGWQAQIGDASDPCGPAGLAVAGGKLLVSCELSRRVARIDAEEGKAPKAILSDELFESKLDAAERRGRDLFRRGNNTAISSRGALACSSCHAEARTDGLTWRIEGHSLQTPLLAGRLEGTHPFKWDGKDATLKDSLQNTVKRLGGGGISGEQVKDLRAFLDSLPPPRGAARPTQAVARGKKLFQSKETGCATCHSGTRHTDGKLHDLALDLEKVDTPSLVGLAVSAPYFHDGSATTLRAALLENGSIHDMGSTRTLSDAELNDLITYLETL